MLVIVNNYTFNLNTFDICITFVFSLISVCKKRRCKLVRNYTPENMYLNINIILIILLYQCSMICTFQLGMEKHQSKISSKSGWGMFIKSLSSIGKRAIFPESFVSIHTNLNKNMSTLDFVIEGLNDVKHKIDVVTQKREQNNSNPRLVAVSKTKPIEQIICIYKQGQRHFGENYVQELLTKSFNPEVLVECPDIRWHFIGHLQRNKVSKVLSVPGLYLIETIDSERIAKAINDGWKKLNKDTKLKVMIQVNTSNETEKSGVPTDKVVDLYKYIIENCENLELVGIMTIGQYGYDCSQGPNPDFLALIDCKKNVCDNLKLNSSEVELSMGMSSDYEHAIELGSTNVRVGSNIFGYRPRKEKQ